MFSSIDNKKVYQLVIEQIQKLILKGDIKEGDKLPSERELSETMNVSRTSIREAIRVMESMGLVDSRQGEGNYICSNLEKSLLEPLSIAFKLNGGTLEDLLELREALELQTVYLAAQKITEEEAIVLKNIIDEMKKEIEYKNREEVLVLIDEKFHNEIANISKNFLLTSLIKTSSSLFEGLIMNARQSIIKNHSDKNILFKVHNEIYKAIIKRDPILSQYKMKKHLDLIRIYSENI